MARHIYRLVYLSRNAIEGDEHRQRQEIDQILTMARHNNEYTGVTGALMFNSGCFAQVLEGTHDAIQDTFERIQCDMRHSDVVVLVFDEADTRKFSNWSMAYVGEDTQASDAFADIASKSGFNLAELDGDRVFDLLQEHMREAEAEVA